jgi:cytochrome c-type biogenesis protein CcmH
MRTLAAAVLLLFAALASGQERDPKGEQRMKTLADELRCLVCQNQTIADSTAPLAEDLRNQIRGQIAQGRTDTQIRDYMVERYGDFVLYRPPFKAATTLLWLGPPALLVGGAFAWLVVVRRRKALAATSQPETSAKRREEIEKLLEEKA